MKSLSKQFHKVWDKSGGRCWYCGVQITSLANWTVDHVVPRCLGGTSHLDNLVPCCKSCNSRKSGRSIERLRYLMSPRTGPIFSDEQITYLASRGITFPTDEATYRFFYEGLESGAGE